jgi:hypothetical protein
MHASSTYRANTLARLYGVPSAVRDECHLSQLLTLFRNAERIEEEDSWRYSEKLGDFGSVSKRLGMFRMRRQD